MDGHLGVHARKPPAERAVMQARQPKGRDEERVDPFRPATGAGHSGDCGRLSETAEAKVASILAGMVCYLDVVASPAAVEELVRQAYGTQSEIYGKEKAAEWGGQFTIPEEAVDSDERLLKANGNNFRRMAWQRFQLNLPQRLNEERVSSLSADNPERGRLLGLAAGMEVPLPVGFQPNGKLDHRTGERARDHTGAEPLRKLYEETAPAVNKQLMKLHALGLAFILRADTVFRMLEGDHKMVASWAPKAGSEAGRVLMDPSHTKVMNGWVMNGKEVKGACQALWLPIQHPTIAELIVMVLSFYIEAEKKDPAVRWADVILWKMDLRAAFTLLSVAPKNTPLFTMNLTRGLVIIVLCGLFGWTGTPFAFQVVTRALVFELLRLTAGALRMYVDDIMGVCLRKDLRAEQETARRVSTGLLGPTAVAEDKTEDGRVLVWIGYLVDLDRQLVNMSPRNFRKCLFAFFAVDLTAKVPVKTLERLASLAERYSELYQYMRPFQRALYNCYKGCQGMREHVCVDMTEHPGTVRAIRFWRVMLCAAALNEERFARTFASFLPKAPQYVVEFDGCLQGVGILVYEAQQNGSEVLKGGGAMDLGPLGFGSDSAYQNLGEFLGPTLAPVVLRALGLGGAGQPYVIHLRGDSVTGLRWADTRRFKGTNVSNAAMVFTAMVMGGVVEVVGTTHFPAEENKKADGLSRHKTMGELGLDGVPFVDLNRDPTALTIRGLCDPALDVGTDEEFASHWKRSHDVVLSLLSLL